MENVEYLKPSEVAAILRVQSAMVYRMIASGEIPSVRITRKCIRVPRQEFFEWLRSRKNGGK